MSEPAGPPVRHKGSARLPPRTPLHGRYTSVLPLHADHWPSLYKHLGGPNNFPRWTYMLTSGFKDERECEASVKAWEVSPDLVYYVVLSGQASDPSSEPAGIISYLAVVPQHQRVEIGSVILGEALSHSRQATEAFYLFIRHAFEDLGNTRVEWKANNHNKPSLAAALRLGFTFEGIFRKHMVVKGKERDTAWFSIADDEWPKVKKGFEVWLDVSNFDENGNQKRGLRECRETIN